MAILAPHTRAVFPAGGCFGRFLGPRGPKWRFHFLTLTQKERRAGQAECTQVTLFLYNCWVSVAKTQFGPVSGVPVFWELTKNYAAGPFIHEYKG